MIRELRKEEVLAEMEGCHREVALGPKRSPKDERKLEVEENDRGL